MRKLLVWLLIVAVGIVIVFITADPGDPKTCAVQGINCPASYVPPVEPSAGQ